MIAPHPARPATLTAVAAVIATAALTGPPSYAARQVTRDSHHDVVRTHLDDEGPLDDVVPGHRQGDLVSSRVVHTRDQVRVTLRYAALSRPRVGLVVHDVRLATPRDARPADLSLLVRPRKPQGRTLFHAEGVSGGCPGRTSHVDYRHDTVRLVVPRRCLGDPRWVRVGAGALQVRGDLLHVDDVGRDGVVGDDLALGGRVTSG